MITLDSQPTKAAGQLNPFHLLQRNSTLQSNNLGGKFALPLEFDSTTLAGALYAEGQEVRAMEATQPVLGTTYVSPGWVVWKYPSVRPTGKLDTNGKPVTEKHPMADQQHKVAGTKAGENYVLMCRPLDVQAQVNSVYGQLSTEMMVSEALGETLTGDDGDTGMLSNQRLAAEIGADREVEAITTGRSSTVINGPQINRTQQRVSR